jgi:hypothetical protein
MISSAVLIVVAATEQHGKHHPAGSLQASDSTQEGESSSSKPQVCMFGKAVPTLINIGAAKCGTTTLSELASAGGAEPFAGVKEPKAFGVGHEALNDTVDDEDRKAFADHSVYDCDADVTLYDMSPDYMSIPGMARRVKQIYADDADKLCITALIREPVARMQSHMYYGTVHKNLTAQEANKWAQSDYDQLPETYEAAVQNYPGVPAMTAMGLYGHQMKEWLQEFNQNRVVIMPMMWAMGHQVEAIQLINTQCRGLEMNTTSVANMPDRRKHELDSGSMDNQPQHGLVFHKDLVRDFRRKLFYQDEDVLAKVLSAHTPGVAIGGLKSGVHHPPTTIKAHFRHLWGSKD